MNGGSTEEEAVKVNGDVSNGGGEVVENGHVNGTEEELKELHSDGSAPLL